MAQLAANAPDPVSKSAVFGAVKMIREYHGFSDAEKSDLIAKSLRLGCSTYDDLVAETKLHITHIKEIVKGMQEAGRVELRPLQSGEKGGRPMVFIALTTADSR